MNRSAKLGMAFGLCWLLFNNQGYAEEIRWSGFGSIVGGKTLDTEKLVDGTDSTYQPDPSLTGYSDAFYGDAFSFTPDTNFGLQMDMDLGDGLSATTQVTARGGNNFELEATWLYASYKFKPTLTGRIGRQRTPLYLYSDYLDVGYAYHWLRAPLELYGESANVYEGVSGLYKNSVGDWDYELQAYYGKAHAPTGGSGDTHIDNLTGAVASFSYDWLKLRASVHQGEAWGPDAPMMDEDNAQDLVFTSFGVAIDRQDFFVISEITLLHVDQYAQTGLPPFVTFDKRKSWMVSAGVHINTFTPHITYTSRDTTLSGDSIPQLNNLVTGSDTVNIGMRWDFHPQAAMKLDYTSASDNSDAPLISAGGEKLSVDVIAAGIDFIF